MKITERRLIEDDVIVRGYSVIRRSIIINGDTYTLELDPISGDGKFYINKEYISEGCKAYTDFEEATGVLTKHFGKYLNKIKYSKFKDCCKKKATWMKGHPGEYLLVCPVCNRVLDTVECLGEIM
jgi:hypothetical protein